MEERGFSPKRSQSHEQGSEIVESKWCPRCQQYVSRDLFYRNAAQFDGLAPYAKHVG